MDIPQQFHPPKKVLSFFNNYTSFLLIGHQEPDGDCLYSQLVLHQVLLRMGKQSRMYSPGPFLRPEIKALSGSFHAHIHPDEKHDAACVVLDCSTLERIGYLQNEIDDLPVLVIDHHSAGEDFGRVRWVNPAIPATCLLVLGLLSSWNIVPTQEEAEGMLFGLCTDTGFFRHLSGGKGDTLKAAGELNDCGASLTDVHRKIYGNRDFSARIFLSRTLERTRILEKGAILITYETLQDKEELGIENRDSDTLYQLLQATRGCKLAALVREEGKESYSVSLRATDNLNVGELARQAGGGGHRLAAGFQTRGTREEIINRVACMLKQLLRTS